MRTVRWSSRLPGWGWVCRGGSAWGVSAQGGVCPGGGCLPGGVSAQGTEWQTGIKILPCRNFVADGKNSVSLGLESPFIISIINLCLLPHSPDMYEHM